MDPMSGEAHFHTVINSLDCSTSQSLPNDPSTGSETPRGPEIGSTVRKKVFICEICGISKVTLRELTRHSLIHVGAMPYYCLKCPFVSISLTQLYRHLVKHIEFMDDDAVQQRRLKAVLGRMVHVCNLCKLSFKFYNDLVSHYLMHIKASYKCMQCSFVFFSEADCLIHSHLHDAVACKVCSTSFGSNHNSAYLTHVLDHDHTKLYRKFPRSFPMQVEHKSIPYYKPFFDICYKISHFNTHLQRRPYCTVNQANDINSPVSNVRFSEFSDQFGMNLDEICKVVLEKEDSAFVFNRNCCGNVIDKQNMCNDSVSLQEHLPDHESSVWNLARNPEVESGTAAATNFEDAVIECIDLDTDLTDSESSELGDEELRIDTNSVDSEPAVQFTSNP